MAGAIVDLSSAGPPDTPPSIDVCVIGSGPGGATAARALARAGFTVLVLEEGGNFTGGQLTQRDGEMYDQLYMDRGGRGTADLSIMVLQGRVLGGGSVINTCDVVPIPDHVLEHWVSTFGLTDFSPSALAPHRERTLADLSASVPTDDWLNRNNSILRAGSTALGFKGEIMAHNRVGCAGLGTCLIGCPIDAKRNARTVLLPEALEAGANVWVRARAVRIEAANDELKRVRVRVLDPRGYREVADTEVRARCVVVAASGIGTPALLLRSGIGNAHVGKNLMLQPQLPITALFDEQVKMYRGIPQAYAVTEFEEHASGSRGLGGFRIESIAGTPGMVSSLLPWMGAEGKRWMNRYANFASALLLAPDAPSGRVEVEPSGRIQIHYALSSEQIARFRKAAETAARIYFAAGAKEVLVPTVPPIRIEKEANLGALREMSLLPATAPLLSAHQQGTVRCAPSPELGAANPEGAVYGARGVYVVDSSLFPTSASSHIMAPIMTVAGALSERLATSLRKG